MENNHASLLGGLRVTGPHAAENLEVYLIHGPDICDGGRFVSLSEALGRKDAIVHETGTVGMLEIENLSPNLDLLILAGEVVKGGRQDRTLGVDMVVPARSSRIPIPSFCVEQGRWSRRGGEDARYFLASSSSLPKELLLAAKVAKSQQLVWQAVNQAKSSLAESLRDDPSSPVSPSSYHLLTENHQLRKRQAQLRHGLTELVERHPDARGFAFVVDHRLSTADVFGSARLARIHYGKLLDAAIITALAESTRRAAASPDSQAITAGQVQTWLDEVAGGPVQEVREVAPRLQVEVRTHAANRATCFSSVDRELGTCLHRNWMAP